MIEALARVAQASLYIFGFEVWEFLPNLSR